MNIKNIVFWILFCPLATCMAEERPFSKLSFFENPQSFGAECAKIVPNPKVTISLIKNDHAVIFSEDEDGTVYLFLNPSAVENKKLVVDGKPVKFNPEKVEARFYDTVTTKDGTFDDLEKIHKRVVGGKFRFRKKSKVQIYFELFSSQGKVSFSFSKDHGIWTVREEVEKKNNK